jgi:hypothetical protein
MIQTKMPNHPRQDVALTLADEGNASKQQKLSLEEGIRQTMRRGPSSNFIDASNSFV